MSSAVYFCGTRLLQHLHPSLPTYGTDGAAFAGWEGRRTVYPWIFICFPCFALQMANPRSGKDVHQQERTIPTELDTFPNMAPSFHTNPG